jgi:hypothetical protein
MGSLTPGVPLIYERANGIIYAREHGKIERRIVGYEQGADYDPIQTSVNWNEMCRVAKSNPALKNALEQCIMIYKLSKENE